MLDDAQAKVRGAAIIIVINEDEQLRIAEVQETDEVVHGWQ